MIVYVRQRRYFQEESQKGMGERSDFFSPYRVVDIRLPSGSDFHL